MFSSNVLLIKKEMHVVPLPHMLEIFMGSLISLMIPIVKFVAKEQLNGIGIQVECAVLIEMQSMAIKLV
jgi:hypothetical protein